MSRFIDLTTDFGFKKIFGDEANKEIIMGFITDVLELATPLLDIEFKDKEQLPEAEEERSGVYDIYCQDLTGNQFIVEMQKNRIPFVTDRLIYYSTFPLAAQAKKGGKHVIYPEPSFEPSFISETATTAYGNKTKAVAKPWDFRLSEVYCIAVLGYALKGSTAAVNRNRIRNDQPPHAPFSDKLQFVTLELPFFDETKTEYSLDRRVNKWLFFLKYLPYLKEIVEEGQNMLCLLFSQKLGSIPPEIDEAIRGLNDLEQIRRILAQFTGINDWQTLQNYLPKLPLGNDS